MPHIHAILAEDDSEVKGFLEGNRVTIVVKVASRFGYKEGDVALIPKLLTPAEVALSWNMSRLMLVVDLGTRLPPYDIGDRDAEDFLLSLIKVCEMDKINVGVWIRSMPSNGYAEHEPEPPSAA